MYIIGVIISCKKQLVLNMLHLCFKGKLAIWFNLWGVSKEEGLNLKKKADLNERSK